MEKAADALVRELGERVERGWQAHHYDDDAFPEVAMRVLSESKVRERTTPLRLARWFAAQPTAPRQLDDAGAFGNPPLTLFHGGRFVVDLYFWLDGAPNIHQHDFQGAFLVLSGGSVHARFSWKTRRRYNASFELGTLTRESVELLAEGDARPIQAGGQFIHALFHLQRPSTTLVIRNIVTPGTSGQLQYYPPGVAIDGHRHEPWLQRKLTLLDTVRQMDSASWRRMALGLLEGSDPFITFQVLEHLLLSAGGPQHLAPFLAKAEQRFGRAFAEAARAALEESVRQRRVVALRARVHGEEHRFFLALLLNFRDRAPIDQLIRQRFGLKRSTPLLERWIRELVAAEEGGQNALDLPLGEAELQVLSLLLDGCSLAELHRRLAKRYGDRALAARAQEVNALVQAFRSSLFAPLLTP